MEAAGSTSPRPAGHVYHAGSTRKPVGARVGHSASFISNISSVAGPIYNRLQNASGKLELVQLDEFMASVAEAAGPDVPISPQVDPAVITSVAGTAKQLTYDQAMAIVGMMQSSLQPSTSALSLSSERSAASLSGAANGSPSRVPLKKALAKNRAYLETGTLAYDEAVVQYMQKLEEHRRKCESEGRYAEAKAAARRLAELRTAQVARLRQELVDNQAKELGEVNMVYEEETIKFTKMWDSRVSEYESNFAKAVEELKALHEEQRRKHEEELLAKRPTKPKPSKEYLQQKGRERSLARNQEYVLALQVKEAADELYAAELQQTHAAFEAEQKLRMAKFMARQQAEFEALLQRGARGRDELELKRVAETERRTNRFRNIVMELESLHRLELVQLEAFLDAQVQAGKAAPLKDASAFRRKRESLYNTAF